MRFSWITEEGNCHAGKSASSRDIGYRAAVRALALGRAVAGGRRPRAAYLSAPSPARLDRQTRPGAGVAKEEAREEVRAGFHRRLSRGARARARGQIRAGDRRVPRTRA